MKTHNERTTSSLIRGYSIIIILLISAFCLSPANAACNGAMVAFEGQVIVVHPNASDDTVNIQCALDEAVAGEYKTVRLTSGNFHISSILISDFAGTIEGKSKLATTLNIIESSIDCDGMELSGKTSAAIKFVEGEPRIRFMTIQSGHACQTSSRLEALIHFSGTPSDGSECSNDVIFANADRIILHSSNLETRRGILAAAESYVLDGCKNTLLGTFKLNQSEIKGYIKGVETSMRSGAQVDLNFTVFENRTDIQIADSNQSTTITNNTFSGASGSGLGSYIAIRLITNNAEAPDTTAFTIKNNKFTVTAANNIKSWAILAHQGQKIAVMNVIISNNNINLSDIATGVAVTDISNGVIIGNTFSGTGQKGIEIGANGLSENTQNWTIIANSGFAGLNPSFADIHLGPAAANSIIGSGQGAVIVDWGTNNTQVP